MKNSNKMIFLLGLMSFLTNGDNYAAASLIINISRDLNISISDAAISVTAYMLFFGIFTLIFGPLSDRYGKVRILNIAAIGTAIFSILCAFSFNLPSLIILRAVNGAFAAGILPVTMALIGQNVNNEDRQKVLGKVMGMMFLGGATATAIGGTLAYLGSWRLVYLIYGVSELCLAILMRKKLEKDEPIVEKLHFLNAYKEALTNYRFMRLVITILLVGFSVFGSFTYSGKLIQEVTGYNILVVGLILSVFGVGTVVGGRLAPKIKILLKQRFLIFAGLIGSVSLFAFSTYKNVWILSLGLMGFGIAFIFLQSTLITAVQEKLPKMRGTAMSMASFNMFVGGAIGTSINGTIMKTYDTSKIFYNTAYLIFFVSILAAIFISRFEMRKKQGIYS